MSKGASKKLNPMTQIELQNFLSLLSFASKTEVNGAVKTQALITEESPVLFCSLQSFPLQ